MTIAPACGQISSASYQRSCTLIVVVLPQTCVPRCVISNPFGVGCAVCLCTLIASCPCTTAGDCLYSHYIHAPPGVMRYIRPWAFCLRFFYGWGGHQLRCLPLYTYSFMPLHNTWRLSILTLHTRPPRREV